MTTFLELSNDIRGLLGLWYVLLMLFACVTSYMFFTLKKYHMSVLSALSTLTCYIFVQWFSDIGICYNKKLVPPHSVNLIDSADWKWLLLIGFFLTILIICTFLNALYWNKNIVSSRALKAGMDNLPSGLCWYYEDGTIALRNSKMENICYLLTGEKLRLGDLFEKALSENIDEDSDSETKFIDSAAYLVMPSSNGKNNTIALLTGLNSDEFSNSHKEKIHKVLTKLLNEQFAKIRKDCEKQLSSNSSLEVCQSLPLTLVEAMISKSDLPNSEEDGENASVEIVKKEAGSCGSSCGVIVFLTIMMIILFKIIF